MMVSKGLNSVTLFQSRPGGKLRALSSANTPVFPEFLHSDKNPQIVFNRASHSDMPGSLMKPLSRLAIVAGTLLLGLSACSSVPSPKEVELWQSRTIAAQKDSKRTLIRELRSIDKIREETLDLEASRSRCLALLKRFPDTAPVLWRAARAESDYLLILKSRKATEWERNLAALSSLKFVQRAQSLLRQDNASSALLGQLAWSMRTSAHIQGMFSQAKWDIETFEVAKRAFAKNSKESRALATLSILHWRLATRSDFTKLVTMSVPKGSLEESIQLGLRCIELRPSLEHHVLLARSYMAAEKYKDADELLQKALKRSDRYPRDRYYREQAMQVLDRTTRELNKYQF
ncbi:MAG: hypothetical protein P1V97_34855 [Planctomycetota bacterium]|nr:hypothetical protein [Planctomycetota bacterium]